MTTASAAPAATKKKGAGAMAVMQRIGRSLMLPVAVLPAAALLVRLGNADMLGRESFPTFITKLAGYMAAGGGAILDNMALLFAVGIAIGFAKKSDGSTALAAVTGYLVFQKVLATFTDSNLPQVASVVDGKIVMSDAPVNAGVLGGVVIGIVVALLYQRFYRKKLPDWAGFFSGRRLVPILSAFAGLIIGIVFGLIWPVLGTGLHNFGEWLVGSGAVGAGIFGVANRALIPVGMHHLLNSFPWFQAGEYKGAHGDIARFLAGDPQAGQFMTGFFPIMMFALPAACLAIVHCARPERRKVVGGMMFSLAATSFVTGVTEPIEFTFMFIAPVLYAIHAVLTGVSMALTWALGMKDGFGFSAGLIDFGLNLGIATKPWMLVLVGLCFAVVYYVVFRFAITKFNLPTPGRESDEELAELLKAEAK
ncbi:MULTISPECIES: PTS transporter subunit EIIC [Streptomyces]|jgi:PTS system N-acetylglucosamine-specific IIC component|uniref:PTS transporter subunit EIIC n=1 Tax=unclassified Streptomyces TaxID=2593676 RepID=UPI000887B3DC|nr:MULTISPECIES: PTS transporter subunit EIIC [unclassified Streptomyces]MDX2728425.1 PTS transporter subunit EIIC [Streptomyces sp. PA03-2a]MDX3769255.1 PTS transporter subunit EIIC [Streptomyces sp. AK08-01B]MDX3818319.1 PTS transporter subunit EIIC [Streptomyces sp. AK08-01A]WSG81331.1 PTS transporter subunit EIIC [Streptomyces sp. NBC_01727]SCZ06890.1 PTS system N-acetylglucosamine-specific IIC component, Glc family [Streptomyces sp. 136MFCol5.1]